MQFNQAQLVAFSRCAVRRCLGGLRVFPGLRLRFGIALLAMATIFFTNPGQRASGLFIAAVGAAEDKVSDWPRFGQLVPQQDRCLSRQEQRARVAAHAAIPLGKAVREVKGTGDLLRARLCERRGKLLYLVTVLGRSGRVQRFAIDAKTGRLVGARH